MNQIVDVRTRNRPSTTASSTTLSTRRKQPDSIVDAATEDVVSVSLSSQRGERNGCLSPRAIRTMGENAGQPPHIFNR
jgi:hypothetical protein